MNYRVGKEESGLAFDSRRTRRMLERMGVDMKQIPNVEEVVIRTVEKDLIIKGANVSEINAKGMRVFQVMGSEVEEVEREKPRYSEEDILLVAQQAGVSRETAEAALAETGGDLAQAILKLTT